MCIHDGLIFTMNSQIENYLILIGNQSLDSDVCSRHEFPDLFFKVIWEVQSSKRFKIHAQHSL